MKRTFLIFLSFLICAVAINSQTTVSFDHPFDDTFAEASQLEEKDSDYETGVSIVSNEETSIQKIPLYKQTRPWHKYKKLEKWGWSLLGAGIATTFLGTAALLSNLNGHGNSSVGSEILFVGGCLMTVSSLPILMSAYYFRYKATHLKIGLNTMTIPNRDLSVSHTPALSFSYSF